MMGIMIGGGGNLSTFYVGSALLGSLNALVYVLCLVSMGLLASSVPSAPESDVVCLFFFNLLL